MSTNNLWATRFSGDFVPGANDHASYWTNGNLLGGLSGCRDAYATTGGVTVEGTQIPSWVWLALGAAAVLFLLKKK